MSGQGLCGVPEQGGQPRPLARVVVESFDHSGFKQPVSDGHVDLDNVDPLPVKYQGAIDPDVKPLAKGLDVTGHVKGYDCSPIRRASQWR